VDKTGELQTTSVAGKALNGVLLLMVLAAFVASVYIAVLPRDEEPYTEFYLYGGEDPRSPYPQNLRAGVPAKLTIGISNHEHRFKVYALEIFACNSTIDPTTGENRIVTMVPLYNASVPLEHAATSGIPFTAILNETKYNTLEFLLFDGQAPPVSVTGNERIQASYRNVYLRIRVTKTQIEGPLL
jgi:uncharacterized membrane protein